MLLRLAHIKEEKSRRRNPLRLCQSAFESEFGLPPGCTRRLDDIVGGIAKHNLRNRRLRAGGKPLADSYRHVRIASSLVDSGNMNLITAFRWRSPTRGVQTSLFELRRPAPRHVLEVPPFVFEDAHRRSKCERDGSGAGKVCVDSTSKTSQQNWPKNPFLASTCGVQTS